MQPAPSRLARIAGVVIPIRAFSLGKARLAEALAPDERAELAERMAERVLAAAGPLPVVVVSSAPEVRSWARARGTALLDDPGTLDLAAATGAAWCARHGLTRVVVSHADLPRAPVHGLVPLALDAGRPVAALVPCHRGDGTPVLSVPTAGPFQFGYGPGSFRHHVQAARTAGLAVRVVRDANLAFDVDLPVDLASLDAMGVAVPSRP